MPSGGSRHPTEVFQLVVTRGLDLSMGLYHYHPATHSLDRLARDKRLEVIGAFTGVVPDAVAFPALTLLRERSMWRYREARC